MSDELFNEILYGRDARHARVFISSRMNGSLDEERQRAADAVERLESHRAWWWERDAPMGVLHSELECIRFAGASDGLILLVGGELSAIVYAEYRAAKDAAAETYIFIREPSEELPEAVRQFISAERDDRRVTRNFRNLAELESHVYAALNMTAVRAMRQMQLQRLMRERRV